MPTRGLGGATNAWARCALPTLPATGRRQAQVGVRHSGFPLRGPGMTGACRVGKGHRPCPRGGWVAPSTRGHAALCPPYRLPDDVGAQVGVRHSGFPQRGPGMTGACRVGKGHRPCPRGVWAAPPTRGHAALCPPYRLSDDVGRRSAFVIPVCRCADLGMTGGPPSNMSRRGICVIGYDSSQVARRRPETLKRIARC